ncbi:MAG: host attachment protein [Rhodospirillales bacterium]|nr:host attachment protein [Rhodospirillales bacterium]
MGKNVTWVFVGDGSRARIVFNDGPGKGLQQAFDREFVQPLQSTHELGTERPSSRGSEAGGMRHGVAPRADWHDQQKESFAAEMAKLLTEAAVRGDFDRLVLVAPPKTLGTLRRKLGPAASKKIIADSPKDLTHVPIHDLARPLARLLAL